MSKTPKINYCLYCNDAELWGHLTNVKRYEALFKGRYSLGIHTIYLSIHNPEYLEHWIDHAHTYHDDLYNNCVPIPKMAGS